MKKVFIVLCLLLWYVTNANGQWYVRIYNVTDINYLSQEQLNGSLSDSKSGMSILIIAVSFSFLYALFEFIMGMKQRRKGSVAKSGDKGSIWLLFISISIGYWLSYIACATGIGRINHWNTFFVFGVVLIVIGLIIRITSIRTLKQHFTYTVTKIENHELIEKGLYKTIRHPGYLGQLIIFTGLSALLSSWLSIILMVVPVLSAYIYRITVEERFMTEQMGEKYTDYQKRTKRLIPLIY